MANEDHVTRAGYAVASWNRWRDQHPDVVPDLSGADLSAGRYPEGKLFGANLAGTDFRKSNLRGADFRDSNLEGADLSKTVLAGAVLTGARLAKADLAKADLTQANLEGADLAGANLEKANLDRANLSGATLDQTNLCKADLGATLGVTQRELARALGDDTTGVPAGLERPTHWGTAEG